MTNTNECSCCGKQRHQLTVRSLISGDRDIIDVALRILKSASDPFSGVINFLQARPEGTCLSGYLINRALIEAFGENEKIPGLIQVLSNHVHEVVRQSNVINIINEHPSTERWGNYLIKAKDRIKFEVASEKGMLVLKNIAGLVGVEGPIEAPLEKIVVKPPKLIVTLRLGLLAPERVLDI